MKKSLVTTKDKEVVTDSLTVAENFGKKHKHVLEKIRNVIRDDADNRLIFRPVDFKDAKGETRGKYIMDRRSFSILCMSFTGKKALKWKNRFYDAFEAMEKALLQMSVQRQSDAWLGQRQAGKIIRREQTDIIQEFVVDFGDFFQGFVSGVAWGRWQEIQAQQQRIVEAIEKLK